MEGLWFALSQIRFLLIYNPGGWAPMYKDVSCPDYYQRGAFPARYVTAARKQGVAHTGAEEGAGALERYSS